MSKIDLIYLINPTDNELVKMDNLKKKRRCLVIFFVIILLSIVGTVFFGFFACNEEICAFSKKKLFPDHHFHQYQLSHQLDNLSSLNKHKLDSHLKGLSYDEVLNDDFQSKFDINKFDVMVSMSLFLPYHFCCDYNWKITLSLFHLLSRFSCTYKRWVTANKVRSALDVWSCIFFCFVAVLLDRRHKLW